MTAEALEIFVDLYANIIMDDNIAESCLMFRDESLLFYQNDETAALKVPYDVIDQIDEKQLMTAIKKGLEVEGYTRITGYMARISAFNPGKQAELKDRHRMTLDGRTVMPGSCGTCKQAEAV